MNFFNCRPEGTHFWVQCLAIFSHHLAQSAHPTMNGDATIITICASLGDFRWAMIHPMNIAITIMVQIPRIQPSMFRALFCLALSMRASMFPSMFLLFLF